MKSRSKKRVGCVMVAVAFLATLLGVTNLMDRSESNGQNWHLDDVLPNGVSKAAEWTKNKFENVKSHFMSPEPPPLPPIPKAAESAKAEEILNSVGNAAYIFSCRAGGGGDSLFPTNAFQMRDNLPPVVANSVEGCLSTPVVPLGGYICQYEVHPARTNFLCKALPANGYTGSVFAVRKDMAIIHVCDITCSATNSVPQK